MYARELSASGLAAVWARNNTREALWDAMARKEVFGTTGTRLIVRVFGGFGFTQKISIAPTLPPTATRRACRWAAISKQPRPAKCRHC